jgi:hypothetical protein
MSYPELQYRGNYNGDGSSGGSASVDVTLAVNYTVLSCQFGDGYEENALFGSPGGTRLWTLNYPALWRRPFGAGAPMFSSQSRADYLYGFYCDRLANSNEPFILQCPFNKKRYLARFSDTMLTLTLMDQLMAATGVHLKQARVAGVTNVNDDGSID